MTVQEATQQLLFQLYHLYDHREARNITDLVMEKVTEWKRIDRVMNKRVPLSDTQEAVLATYTADLMVHRPVQYVLQEAWFMGMPLYVDEQVLIPRPETEELVNWIVEDQQLRLTAEAKTAGDRRVRYSLLDIGTGSGCIAIGCGKKLPGISVYGCDVSEEALEVARRNAAAHKVSMQCIRCDFLDAGQRAKLPEVNIIASNPPYIPLQDKAAMSDNVVKYEPHTALFVQDSQPLVFYKAIADFAKTHLASDGTLYAEIHESYGTQVTALLQQEGFARVELKKDLQGKDRMVKASR
jgi:release factor glutamine methyltransferase